MTGAPHRQLRESGPVRPSLRTNARQQHSGVGKVPDGGQDEPCADLMLVLGGRGLSAQTVGPHPALAWPQPCRSAMVLPRGPAFPSLLACVAFRLEQAEGGWEWPGKPSASDMGLL